MASWQDVERAEPEFSGRVRALFDAHKHKVLATLRADGSPRVSGIEVTFRDGGIYFGSMPDAVKARDLLRDPRFALHCGSPDPPADPTTWTGDVKLSGRAREVTDPVELARHRESLEEQPPGPYHLFTADLSDLVHTRVGTPADHLVIEVWQPGVGLRRFTRS